MLSLQGLDFALEKSCFLRPVTLWQKLFEKRGVERGTVSLEKYRERVDKTV